VKFKKTTTVIATGIVLMGSLFGFGLITSATNYGNIDIIDDSVMNNTGTMSAAQIDSFLNGFAGTCLGTNSGFATPDPQGYSNGAYQFGSNVSAGTAIQDIAVHYDLNPQVLIVTLEKEQGLIDRNGSCDYNNPAPAPAGADCGSPYGTGPSYCSYACQNSPVGGCVTIAAGYACPGYCQNTFLGFSQQISGASWVLRWAEARAEGLMTDYPGYDAGDESYCYTGPMTPGYRQRSDSTTNCDGVPGNQSIYYDGSYTDANGDTMYISNGATASMLNYTPFYANSYLPSDTFITKFTQWFSSPNYIPPTCNSRISNVSCVWQLHSPSVDSDFLTISDTERNNAVTLSHYEYDTMPFYAFSSQQPGTVPVYRLLLPNEHFYTDSQAELDSLIADGYTYEGIAFYEYPANSATNASYPIYRLNSVNGHLYTASVQERNLLESDGYTYEGIAFNAPSGLASAPDPTPNYLNVYRLCNNSAHLYTEDLAERDNALLNGWTYEGIMLEAPSSATPIPVYRLVNNSSGDYLYTTSSVEENQAINSGWTYQGIAWYVNGTTPQTYRFYINGYHFYTTDLNEALTITNTPGVHYEGVAFGYSQGSSLPVYRLRYEPNSSIHLWTADVNEAISLNNAGWTYEGIAWYASDTATNTPVYRLYNGSVHFYTDSTIERDQAINAGWTYEGIAWYDT
jgi:hypothetical protein